MPAYRDFKPMTPEPPASLPPPPRGLRRRARLGWSPVLSLWFLRLFILPHTIVGIGFIGAGLFGFVVWLFGTDVSGHITELKTSRGKRGETYYVHYAYAVDGIDYPGRLEVSSDIFRGLEVGQPYPVRVVGPVPTWMPQPRGPGSSAANVLALPFFALLWNGILSLFLWMAWVAPWRLWSLMRHGLPTTGIIIGAETRRGGKGSVTYVVRYRYEASPEEEGGLILTSPETFERSMTVARADFAQAAVGQLVTVIYHPKKPKRSLIYEFAEYEAVE